MEKLRFRGDGVFFLYTIVFDVFLGLGGFEGFVLREF